MGIRVDMVTHAHAYAYTIGGMANRKIQTHNDNKKGEDVPVVLFGRWNENFDLESDFMISFGEEGGK